MWTITRWLAGLFLFLGIYGMFFTYQSWQKNEPGIPLGDSRYSTIGLIAFGMVTFAGCYYGYRSAVQQDIQIAFAAGKAAYDSNDPELAVTRLRDADRKAPELPHPIAIHFYLGRALEQLGRNAEAVESYKKFLVYEAAFPALASDFTVAKTSIQALTVAAGSDTA